MRSSGYGRVLRVQSDARPELGDTMGLCTYIRYRDHVQACMYVSIHSTLHGLDGFPIGTLHGTIGALRLIAYQSMPPSSPRIGPGPRKEIFWVAGYTPLRG